jgi:hypothetical protein
MRDERIIVIHDAPYLLEFLSYVDCSQDYARVVVIISDENEDGLDGVSSCPVIRTGLDVDSLRNILLRVLGGGGVDYDGIVSLSDLDYHYAAWFPVFTNVHLRGNVSLLNEGVSLPELRGERMTLVWGAGDYVVAELDGVYVIIPSGTVINAVLEDALAFHKRTRLWHLETSPEKGLTINATLFRGYQQHILLRCNNCIDLTTLNMSRITYEKR